VFTNTLSPTFDIVGQPVDIQITDASNTPSKFTVVSGPSGMTINPVTGVVEWIPTAAQAGANSMTFQLTNSAGTATISLSPIINIASPPQNVVVQGLDTWSPILTWSPPAYDANLVAGYNILLSDPDQTQHEFTVYGQVTSTSIPLPVPGNYIVNIQAIDANGNQGLWTSIAVTYNPLTPNPSYVVNSNNGNPTTQVGQPVSIQLVDMNTAATGDVYKLVSGPAGVSVDPTSGLVSWTPTSAQVGFQTLNFSVTNSVGGASLSVLFYVGPVTSDTNPPNPTYTFTSNGGDPYAVVGQPMTIQVSDLNTAQPSLYQLLNGPAGMTIDPTTGVLTWTPGLSDIGYAYPTIAAYNSAGISYLYPTIQVVFASPANNVTATGSLSTGLIDVSWTDPTYAAEAIAGYDVYLSWTDANGVVWTSGPTFVAAGSDTASLTAVSGYTTFSVTIVAVDSSGNEGAYPLSGTTVTLS
jgi:hypothetical protein